MIAAIDDASIDLETRNMLKEYCAQVGGTNKPGRLTVPTTSANIIV